VAPPIVAVALAALLGLVAPAASAATSRPTRSRGTTSTTGVRYAGPPAPPKASILVDVDTGRVLAEHDDHVLRRPASTIKLLTVLTAERLLRSDAEVQVSEHAASMPARKIGLHAGDVWPLDDILDSALVVSANDAAVALAEAAAGSVAAFAGEMARTARDLGVVDSPTFGDPAGLDDQFSAGGGDWVSAWDMAVIGVAALRDPAITSRASSPVVRFTDPSGHAHRLLNHNRLLTSYPGATGLKTGYTEHAGNTLVASATRDGRTMLAVVLDAPDLYGSVRSLFDTGFGIPAATETGPLLRVHTLAPSTAKRATSAVPVVRIRHRVGSVWLDRDRGEWILLFAGAVVVAVLDLRRRRAR
jgi:D-alanyl-D-alanine carboxypeptidase